MTTEEKRVAVYNYMNEDKMQEQLHRALPGVIPVGRFIRTTYTALLQNPKLFEATRQSLFGSMISMAQLAMEPVLGRAWLIPYNNTKGSQKWLEVQFQLGYKGVMELGHRSGQISKIVPRTIYENEVYDIQFGTEDRLIHKPSFKPDRGEPILYYATYFLKDGTSNFLVLATLDVEKVRQNSKAPNSPAWRDWYEAMAHKTAIKRQGKFNPMDVEYQWGAHLDDLSEARDTSQIPAIEAFTGLDLEKASDPEAGEGKIHQVPPRSPAPAPATEDKELGRDYDAEWDKAVEESELTKEQVDAYLDLGKTAGHIKGTIQEYKMTVLDGPDLVSFLSTAKKWVDSKTETAQDPGTGDEETVLQRALVKTFDAKAEKAGLNAEEMHDYFFEALTKAPAGTTLPQFKADAVNEGLADSMIAEILALRGGVTSEESKLVTKATLGTDADIIIGDFLKSKIQGFSKRLKVYEAEKHLWPIDAQVAYANKIKAMRKDHDEVITAALAEIYPPSEVPLDAKGVTEEEIAAAPAVDPGPATKHCDKCGGDATGELCDKCEADEGGGGGERTTKSLFHQYLQHMGNLKAQLMVKFGKEEGAKKYYAALAEFELTKSNEVDAYDLETQKDIANAMGKLLE